VVAAPAGLAARAVAPSANEPTPKRALRRPRSKTIPVLLEAPESLHGTYSLIRQC
jgi:hypothetical protein